MTTISPSLHYAYFSVQFPSLIPIVQTLPFADSIRRKLLGAEGWYTAGKLGTTFSGKDIDSTNMVDHQHAFILPLDEDMDAYIDHVCIYTPIPLEISTIVALDRIQTEKYFGSTLTLISISSLPPEHIGQKTSHIWETVTPLLSFRYYKKSVGSMEDWWKQEIERFCDVLHVPHPVEITLIEKHPQTRYLWHDFSLIRPSKRKNNKPFYTAVRVRFASQQRFPLVLGEYCHFGMGRFEVVDTPV